MPNERKRDFIIGGLLLAACGVFLVFEYGGFVLLSGKKADNLLKDGLSRCLAAILLGVVLWLLGYGRALYGRNTPILRNILWCLPAVFVAAGNFPFTAIIFGSAKIERFDLIPLLLFECLSVGAMEEILFRGIFFGLISDVLSKTARPKLYAVLLCSTVFGLWHLTNLLSGASVGYTLLQVGYNCLIGAMLAAVFLRVGNILPCIILHAVFNFGGAIVTQLGSGTGWDFGFWTATAIFGILCFCHVAWYLLSLDRKNAIDCNIQ